MHLDSLTRGEVLGLLARSSAEEAYRLAASGEVVEIIRTQTGIGASLRHPFARVLCEAAPPALLAVTCSLCRAKAGLCPHAGAALLCWVEIRPALIDKEPGATWRRGALQPILAPPGAGERQEIDLAHLRNSEELTAALRFQLKLHAGPPAPARLEGERIVVDTTLASGAERRVLVNATALADLLADRYTLSLLRPEGELATLRLSEIWPRPVLRASVPHDGGILLEPGYLLPVAELIPAPGSLAGRPDTCLVHGQKVYRLASPPERLAAYFQRGRALLSGAAAMRFLAHDHFVLHGDPHYLPIGELAATARPPQPELVEIEADEGEAGQVLVRPVYRVGAATLKWSELKRLLKAGFTRHQQGLVRAPDLAPLIEAGLRAQRDGMAGDRLAFLRVATEAKVRPGPRAQELAAVLDCLSGGFPTLAPPPGLRSTLRPYQLDGAAWLWRLRRTGLGALLADDMGLGKTHQAMALLCLLRAEQPDACSLVVCPRGVLEHWRHLLQQYAPEIPVTVYHGLQRSLDDVAAGALVLTTYEVALRSLVELVRRPWAVAIFDEAQRIKNPSTKGARAVKAIPAAFRVALTGTPIENRLLELWSIMDLIIPGYLGSQRSFGAAFREPSQLALERLRRRLAPFILRRVKQQVLADLPEKSEEILTCTLSVEQERIYQEIHSAAAGSLAERLRNRGEDIPYIHIFALLTRLKQVCDHPALIEPRLRGSVPAKLELLDEILDEALAAENRVVIFSQYVKMIELLSAHLQRRRIAHLKLTGQTQQRGYLVQRFNSGLHEPVFLASLLAGGVGIDLTGASVVVHYDRWWNPARENQATDRVHRIGQKRFVQVFKLLTTGTVEERIDAIIRRKVELVDEVITPTEEVLRRLTREELAEVLGIPLGAAGA
ncbi:MAG: DEAD/DEAH box helicase [Acidobacteriota bacterium]